VGGGLRAALPAVLGPRAQAPGPRRRKGSSPFPSRRAAAPPACAPAPPSTAGAPVTHAPSARFLARPEPDLDPCQRLPESRSHSHWASLPEWLCARSTMGWPPVESHNFQERPTPKTLGPVGSASSHARSAQGKTTGSPPCEPVRSHLDHRRCENSATIAQHAPVFRQVRDLIRTSGQVRAGAPANLPRSGAPGSTQGHDLHIASLPDGHTDHHSRTCVTSRRHRRTLASFLTSGGAGGARLQTVPALPSKL
jgi:hypothetical protein